MLNLPVHCIGKMEITSDMMHIRKLNIVSAINYKQNRNELTSSATVLMRASSKSLAIFVGRNLSLRRRARKRLDWTNQSKRKAKENPPSIENPSEIYEIITEEVDIFRNLLFKKCM